MNKNESIEVEDAKYLRNFSQIYSDILNSPEEIKFVDYYFNFNFLFI